MPDFHYHQECRSTFKHKKLQKQAESPLSITKVLLKKYLQHIYYSKQVVQGIHVFKAKYAFSVRRNQCTRREHIGGIL